MLKHNLLLLRLAVCCALLGPILGGCGRNGPERVVVSGSVTYRGKPLEGLIRFVPAKGTRAPVSGALVKDGKYTIDGKGGVPVGTHRVEISSYRPRYGADTDDSPSSGLTGVPMDQILPEKYNAKTELEITVPPGSGRITRNFDLTD